MATRTRKPARRQAKQRRAHETVEAILEAAARILAREGYARANTNRIAQAAGVSVGTLYQYFADKDEICDGLIRSLVERTRVSLLEVEHDPGRPFEDDLRALLAAALDAQRHGPDLYRALDQVPGGLFRRRLRDANALAIGLVRRLLAVHRLELRVRNLDRAAWLVVHTAQALALSSEPEVFDDRLVDETTELFARYLLDHRPSLGA
jgi:AcrR family transcriptional regulator